ncbi:ABC transporter substrate-binding protein [Bifidobacterium magnum]|uniref:ABC transporter, lactose solute-binding protein n=1 Tax=Bifidobacterium magnum TaxID=1692 RepID=A0A087BDZ4_9BIFI|nr:extracellular solute-binding protein [Bifidobacterium magnum]KFI69244.1 ABC transporter, lactose solute-binding protein [Bifidobacterium magnum]
MAHIWRRLIGLCCTLAVVGALTACGNADPRTTLTVWSWEPSMGTLIDQFEHDNPDIAVKQVSTASYDKLDSAIQDGYNTPDVVQLEYYALAQYAVSGQLADITKQAGGYGDFYTPGTWASVHLGGRAYALPMDSGPMAFFYNADVFRQAGVDPTRIHTWNDYYEAAKKLKSIGVYITADSGGDASFYESMIWLAGGHPFATSDNGRHVRISLDTDEGTQSFTRFWQKMIDEGLVDTELTTWSDDWKEAVGDGTVASLFAGAWMPSLLLADVPGTAGLWRVGQMPTEHGEATNAENGGSALAILNSSRVPQAAWRFIDYVCHNRKGIDTRVDAGSFPADVETLHSDAFLNKTTVTDSRGVAVNYFGDQRYNTVLAEAASRVSTGYQYLPFEVYARSDFGKTVGKAYEWANELHAYQQAVSRMAQGLESSKNLPEKPEDRVTLAKGIDQWQFDLKEYGANQGFTIEQ